jgi:hypothetical protein
MSTPSAPCAKALYQTLFIACLVFLFVALFIVGPASRFGFTLTALALAASIGTGRALMRQRDRERESGDRDDRKP